MAHGVVDFELSTGETKLLRFDFNALADLEDKLGKSMTALMSEEQNVGMSTLRALLWAGLKWKDRGLTLERAGTIIQQELDQGKSLREILEPIIKAMTVSGVVRRGSAAVAESSESPN